MGESLIFALLVVASITVVLIVFVIMPNLLQHYRLKRRKAEQPVTHNPSTPAPPFSFQSASASGKPIFRCPNPKCRAFFNEPRKVTNYMVQKLELPERFNVCPKCGALLPNFETPAPKPSIGIDGFVIEKEEVKENG